LLVRSGAISQRHFPEAIIGRVEGALDLCASRLTANGFLPLILAGVLALELVRGAPDVSLAVQQFATDEGGRRGGVDVDDVSSR
jgi:hypothetical protein